MKEEKIGGYEARLNRRANQYRENMQAHDEGLGDSQKEARPEEVEFVNKILDSFDRAQLKSVFLDELKRSGVKEGDANTVALDKIFLRPFSDVEARYKILLNNIEIAAKVKEIADAELQSGTLPENIIKKMQLLFVHEACHAFSRNRIHSLGKNTGKMEIETGYSITNINPLRNNKVTKEFEAFNEGVTQRIAEEIFFEYSRRMGEPADEFLEESINHKRDSFWNYYVFGNQVDQMCERIADYVGLPKEVVWESIKRGYFEKPELFNEETIALFVQTFGEDFLRDYSKYKVGTTFTRLGRFDRTYKFSHPREYADKWLKHLGIEGTL